MRLVTWNMQWARGVDGRVEVERIVADARAFADFDVLCLQEVADGYPELPGGAGDDQFAAVGRLLPGYTVASGIATDAPRPGGGRRRFGNLIASRLPVGAVFAHLLPWPAEAGVKSMQRVAVEASVEAPFGHLRVLTTHLEYYSPAQRRAQVERLRALHAEGHAQALAPRPGEPCDGAFAPVPRGAPALLCGDCNFLPDAAERARLLEPFDDGTPALRDAWDIVHPGTPHAPTVGLHDKSQWPGEPFTFDFVFVSADLAPRVRVLRVEPATQASDHQPVLVELG